MAEYLTNEKKKEIFQEFAGGEINTGSTIGQIALFTYRISELSKHLDTHKKDHSCRRSLLKLVGKRRKLLNYLGKKDIVAYRELIKKLGIRK